MSSPIDPIRPGAGPAPPQNSRRQTRTAPSEAASANLPVPAGPARAAPNDPPRAPTPSMTAHILAQQGARRGLRAGAGVLDDAKSSYQRTEWSGSKDRRAKKGGRAKTEI